MFAANRILLKEIALAVRLHKGNDIFQHIKVQNHHSCIGMFWPDSIMVSGSNTT